jgi:hypothetical protein
MNEPRRPTTRWFSPYGYQIDQEREERVWGVFPPYCGFSRPCSYPMYLRVSWACSLAGISDHKLLGGEALTPP